MRASGAPHLRPGPAKLPLLPPRSLCHGRAPCLESSLFLSGQLFLQDTQIDVPFSRKPLLTPGLGASLLWPLVLTASQHRSLRWGHLASVHLGVRGQAPEEQGHIWPPKVPTALSNLDTEQGAPKL